MRPKDKSGTTATHSPGTADISSAQETLGSFLSLFNPPKILQVQNLPQLLLGIIEEAARITNAQRGTLYLVDHKRGVLTSYIAHGLTTTEITLPVGSGAAGRVVSTGKLHNCKDAYKCEFFDKSFDTQTGFKTRNILAVPIKNDEDVTIGILQLLNKEPQFTADDETFVKTFASYVAISIENAQLYIEREKTFKSAIEMIAHAIDMRDPATAGHSARVSKLCPLLAREMELSDTEQTVLEYAALLHDIGKIGVPDAILLKPGRLDDNEYATIKLHVVHTGEILRKMHWPEEWKDIPVIAAMHHERLDGSGYPEKKKASEMPVMARTLALVDTYDALVAIDRPYRKAISHSKIIKYLGEEVRKDLYDNTVYQALKRLDRSLLKDLYGDRIFDETP